MTPEQIIARNGWPEAAPEIMRILAAAGWAVVPVEPNMKMSDAGKLAIKGSADMLWERERAIVVFKAMIAAAKREA